MIKKVIEKQKKKVFSQNINYNNFLEILDCVKIFNR